MRIRTYSISSSPMLHPHHATLTYSMLKEPAFANPAVQHVGVASSYLASLAPGDRLSVAVKPSSAAFHLPGDGEAETTPIVMVAAGAGIAPFRGFVQERAAQIAAGRKLAEAVLFFGCRNPAEDDLYRDELDRWEALGAVKVRRAYSRTDGKQHVQDRMWEERAELMALWERGSKTYVCGSRGVAENVKRVVIRLAMEMQRLRVERGESDEEPSEQRAMQWFESIRNERYAMDVFD